MGREARLRASPALWRDRPRSIPGQATPPEAKVRGTTPPFPPHPPCHLGSVWGEPDSTKHRDITRLFVIFPTFRLASGGFVDKFALFIDIPPGWSRSRRSEPENRTRTVRFGQIGGRRGERTQAPRRFGRVTRPDRRSWMRPGAERRRYGGKKAVPAIFRGGGRCRADRGPRACVGGSIAARRHASAASRIGSQSGFVAIPGGEGAGGPGPCASRGGRGGNGPPAGRAEGGRRASSVHARCP